MKSVGFEKLEFENRIESITQTFLSLVVFQDSNEEKK